MSAPQSALDSTEMKRRVQETHKAITGHFADLGKRYADLDLEAASWTTSSASGAAAYVFVYLQVSCNLIFPGGPTLNFLGKGGVLGLGATGSLGGQATFNVDPNTLIGASGISFEAAGLSIGGGGFQVTWFQNGSYIGHGEFYGLGVSLGTPGGGTGTFSAG
jgi:hypothetical protein